VEEGESVPSDLAAQVCRAEAEVGLREEKKSTTNRRESGKEESTKKPILTVFVRSRQRGNEGKKKCGRARPKKR